jgi:short-subunit dehydrogenase involved in D-alanine esterification of teichoic acids
MSFPFNKILVVGATSGIGLGLSEKFLAEGKSIIIVGRRSNNLSSFVSEHSAERDRIASYVFDLTKLDQIPDWVAKYVSQHRRESMNLTGSRVSREHPDLDAVFVNSGIQRGFNFSKPESVDLGIFDEELITNYTAPIHLTKAILPFLMAQKQPTTLMYTTSGLAIAPLGRCPGYCATKAALHHFLLSLRNHLKETNVRVIEIAPPAVQTELHDETVQPGTPTQRLSTLRLALMGFRYQEWA